MSSDGNEGTISATDKKRRMSLKGPPLRVVKQVAPAPVQAPPPQTSSISAPKPRPSLAGPSMSERRQSISARSLAKAPVSKPAAATSMVHAPIVQQAPAVDPLATVNARLDKMERQISDIQSVLSKFSALEDLIRPLKVTVTTLEGDVAELSSTVKTLTLKPSSASKNLSEHPFNAVGDGEVVAEQTEFVQEVLNELDQSLDSGEIDLEEYGHSLRYVLGKDSRVAGAAPMMSTPVSQKKHTSTHDFHIPSTFTLPADTPSKFNQSNTSNSVAPSSRPRIQYERTPIKRHVSTSAVSAPFVRSAAGTPISTHNRSTMSTPDKEEENSSQRLNVPLQAAEPKCAPVEPAEEIEHFAKIQMETIVPEEKSNVQFWLGLDLAELNRAVTLLNDLALTRQSEPDFDPSICKEIAFTHDDVATQCLVDTKRANAIILLLCGLKRLRISRRGESKIYSMLTGNSIKV